MACALYGTNRPTKRGLMTGVCASRNLGKLKLTRKHDDFGLPLCLPNGTYLVLYPSNNYLDRVLAP